MNLNISKAEFQLCIATKNIGKLSFTIDDLREFGELAFRDKLEDWSQALALFFVSHPARLTNSGPQ